jgi:predicted ATP-dependent endonuclease of OLD family
MLRTITLDGFRCFEAPISVDFGKLTVLAGVNNVGKSSVAQALMALMQSEQQATGNLLQPIGFFDQAAQTLLEIIR